MKPSLFGAYNNHFAPIKELQIPALDRGYLFGDGVYDVIANNQGKWVALSVHQKRLFLMLLELNYEPLWIKKWVDSLPSLCSTMLQKNRHFSEQNGGMGIYIQITRGTESLRTHLPSPSLQPNILLLPQALNHHPKGIKAISVKDSRWDYGFYKTTSNISSVLLKQQAAAQGAEEAILFHEGKLTESASANVFILKGNTLQTPPISNHVFSGITRFLFLSLLKEYTQLTIEETEICKKSVLEADEIWLTGALKGVCAVSFLDNQAFNTQGDWLEKAQNIYKQHGTTFPYDLSSYRLK